MLCLNEESQDEVSWILNLSMFLSRLRVSNQSDMWRRSTPATLGAARPDPGPRVLYRVVSDRSLAADVSSGSPGLFGVFGDVSPLLVSVGLSGRVAQPLWTPADGGRAVGSVLHLLVFAAELHRLPR